MARVRKDNDQRYLLREEGPFVSLQPDGTLDPNVLPPLAITHTFVVANEAERLALVAQKGDVAIQTDNTTTYILYGTNPAVSGDWVVLTSASVETDPVFTASPAHGISGTDITEWNAAHSWGNHGIQGYLVATAGDKSNWNTAYSWGDHSTEGYLVATTTDKNKWDTAHGWGNHAAAGYALASNLPSGTSQANWNTAYSWGDHSTEGYLTSFSETDPVFSASAASGISAVDTSRWTTAWGWGDHSTAGYLTTETDPVFSASAASGVSAGDITNWTSAYNWGNHSTAGYLINNTNLKDVIYLNLSHGSSNADPDTTTSAWFLTNNTNSPGLGLYWHIQNYAWATKSGNRSQIATSYSGTVSRMYTRHNYSGVWSAWREVAYADGSITGNAATATLASTVTVADSSTASWHNVTWNSGNNLYNCTNNKVQIRADVGYLKCEYINFTHAAATRSSDTTFFTGNGDGYVYTNNGDGTRAALNVPTRTGGNASGTWAISISGNAATADTATKMGRIRNDGVYIYPNTYLLGAQWNFTEQAQLNTPPGTGSWRHVLNIQTHTQHSASYPSYQMSFGSGAIGVRQSTSNTAWAGWRTLAEINSSGDIAADITGSSASCTGNAASATTVYVNDYSGTTNMRILGSHNGSGSNGNVYKSSGIYARMDTNTLYATTFSGALAGNATSATRVAYSDGRTDTASYPVLWGADSSGYTYAYSCNGVKIQSSTGTLFANIFNTNDGGIIGPVTANYGSINVSGAAGSSGGYAGVNVNGRFVLMNNGGSDSGLYNDTHNQWFVNCTENGQTGIYYAGALKGYTYSSGWRVTGNMLATSNVYAYYSDKRLKDVKGQITDALDKVDAIETFYYTHNDTARDLGYEGDDMQVGVAAQSVQEVMPEVVHRAPIDDDGEGGSVSGEDYVTVDYPRLVPLLIEAIKELRAEVKELKGE